MRYNSRVTPPEKEIQLRILETERDGHLIDNYTGAPVIVTAEDLQQVQAKYHRVWILTSRPHECCGYIGSMHIDQHFALVFEGSTSLVYLGP